VIDGKVIVTCYSRYGVNKEEPGNPKDLLRHVLCFDAASGELIWQADVPSQVDEDPYEGFIQEHGYASSTPVSDGQYLFATFGKTGVVAFDLQGKKLWQVNVGTDSDPYRWGDGGSPLVHGDYLIVNAANVGHAIVALRKTDGKEVWKYEDPHLTNCWSTPIVVTTDNRDELVTCVPGKILALDPRTGQELWTADSPIATTTCASVVEHQGVVFAMGGRAGDAIGVRCGGQGDVSATRTIWREKLRAGIGTPVVQQGRLYWTSTGIAFCADCATGKMIYKERLPAKEDEAGNSSRAGRRPTGDYASAIAVNNHVLLTTRDGTTHVIAATAEFKPIGQNSFVDDEGPFNGTPAVGDDAIYIRSNRRLYCIAKKGT
jgi:hypothetical protein